MSTILTEKDGKTKKKKGLDGPSLNKSNRFHCENLGSRSPLSEEKITAPRSHSTDKKRFLNKYCQQSQDFTENSKIKRIGRQDYDDDDIDDAVSKKATSRQLLSQVKGNVPLMQKIDRNLVLFMEVTQVWRRRARTRH